MGELSLLSDVLKVFGSVSDMIRDVSHEASLGTSSTHQAISSNASCPTLENGDPVRYARGLWNFPSVGG